MPARSSSEIALKITRRNGGWCPRGDAAPSGGSGHRLPRGDLAQVSRVLCGSGGARPLNLQKPNSPSKTPKPPSWEGECSQSCLENNITGRKNSAWLAWDERDPQNQVPLDGQGLEMGLLGDSGQGSPVSITHPGWDWRPANPCSWGNVSLPGRQRLLYSFKYFL